MSSPLASARLKRQLLREMVEENLEVRQGRTRGHFRRRRQVVRRWLLRGTVVVVSALAATGLYVGTGALLGDAREAAVPAPPWAGPAVLGIEPGEAPAVPRALDAAVVPLAVRTVALDPGHGGRDHGTVATYGLLEKDLTADISERVRLLLESAGYRVVVTRTGDQAVSLEERAKIANASGADVFVSVHVNWIPNREARGVETYYLGPTNDPFLRSLAASENRDSGYSLADFRTIMDRLYAGVRQDESRHLARAVQHALHEALRAEGAAVSDRGVKTAPFVVLVATEMPAILAEVSCLSNQEEARRLASPRYRQRLAEALVEGITTYAASVGGTASQAPQKGS